MASSDLPLTIPEVVPEGENEIHPENPPSPEENPTSTDENPPSTDENPPSPDENPHSPEENPPSPEENPTSTDENPPSTDENPTSTDENPPSTDENPPPPDENPPSPEPVAVTVVSFSPGKIIPTGNAQILPEGHVKKFVALLKSAQVPHQEQPVPLSDEFLKIDTWFQWLQSTIGATSLSITTDAGGVLGFELGLKPSTLTTTSPIFRFTSAGFGAALGLAPSSFDPGAASGLPGNGDTLIFGLDPPSGSPNLEMTLPEVFDFAGLHVLANVVPFLSEIKLQLDGQLTPATTLPNTPATVLPNTPATTLPNTPVHASRNAIWFEPKRSYKTVARLQFAVPIDEIHDFFTERLLNKTKEDPSKDTKDPPNTLELTAGYVVVVKTLWAMGWQPDRNKFSSEASVTLVVECKINLTNASIDFSVALTIHPSGSFDFDLVPLRTDAFANVLIWLGNLIDIDLQEWMQNMKDNLGMGLPELTGISLGFASGQFTPVYFRLKLRVIHQQAVFMFSYSWSKGGGGRLVAELSTERGISTLDEYQRKLQPGWERYREFEEPKFTPLVLTSFFKTDDSTLTSPPSELGGHMSRLVLQVGADEIALYGRLSLGTAESDFSFDSIVFSGRYNWKSVPKRLEISFTVRCSLQGEHDERPAYMTGEIRRAMVASGKEVWTLSASIENLSISALAKFLGGPSSNEIMAFIGKLQIVSLDIKYTFPSSFSSKGILRLGELELSLTFTHEKSKTDFEATLRPSSKESTIGKVLDSITGSASLDLPPFVSDIKLGGNGPGDSATLKIKFSRTATELFFLASFRLGPLKFTFFQHRRAGSKVIKRVIKVSAQLPQFRIPMIDNPVQPFGELFYMWVHARAEDKAPAGFTADEVMGINAQLSDSHDHLVFKKTTEEKNVSVIAEGSHFVLIGEETRAVTIDYVFQKSAKYDESNTPAVGKKTGPLAVKQPLLRSGGPEIIADTPGDPPGDTPGDTPGGTPGDTHMAPYKKSIGPLSISHIGLQYKDHVLTVHVDAELLLGPIGLSLLGLTLEITLKDEFNLQKIPSGQIKVSLDGMNVAFNQAPIEIAGLFKHTETATEDSYGGGLIVGFDPYRFMAAGVYTKTLGDHGFKSVFVFGKLEGPLIILEFAEISGITGGFGYNIDLKLPQVSEVLQFPFLMDTPSEPGAALAKMYEGGFFKPSEGSFWVAAGLKVTAFQALTVDAVVVVGWNPYVTLGIFGVAVLDVPKLESKANKLLHIELGFAATVDFRSGVMKFEGQLTQNSFILHPDCHLTGGFAIYYWFPAADEAEANPELEGDWVVTIGGYHRRFTPPVHYPKPPPPLGISWKVSKSISVTGESYFAITPKVCMAGVHLRATLSLGPLDAYFDAHADFLINFDPFHFVADVGVSVGVRYTLDMWLVSTPLSVELDAQLHLVGPPFSGRLHVDFRIIGFNINFGPDPVKVVKANLERFYQLVIQDDGTKAKVEDGKPRQNDHVLGCLAGMITDGPSPPGNDDAPQNWKVRAGNFSFRIACRFPINSAGIDSDSPLTSNSNPIYAKPMELKQPLSSTMRIDIKREHETMEWEIAQVLKNVPCALWNIYDSSTDPMQNSDPASLLNADKPTTPLTMGVTISTLSARLPSEKTMPLNPALQDSKNAFASTELHFPPTIPASTKWNPAKPLEKEGEQGVIAKKQWDDVSNKWKESLEQQATVESWRSVFSWTATLKAKAPDRLMKEFGILYMAAPMLSEA